MCSTALAVSWDTGAVTAKTDLHIKLEDEARLLSTKPASETTMKKRLNARSQEKHHLNTGGRKRFHANENPVDVMKSTIPALLPGLYMHVDATKLDNRLSPSVIAALPFQCPTLYVAVDSCTEDPIGRALVFGAQARDPLGILIRDILFRQKRLHRYVMRDGGCEYGAWFFAFCDAVGMSMIKPPVGDPKKNSRAENAIGRTNQLLSHRLLGSTKPDQAGRKVDNRFKSYHTARLLFADVVREVDQTLFGDMPATPTGNNISSPQEKAEVLRDAFGPRGIEQPYDRDFLILTSPIIDRKISADGTRGYRHEGRLYRCPRLSELLRYGHADQKRRDCVDPTVMYCKFGNEWVTAHGSDSILLEESNELDRLFRSMMGQTIRSENAQIRKEISRKRINRVERANAAAPATAHLPIVEKATNDDDLFAFDGFGDADLTPFPKRKI